MYVLHGWNCSIAWCCQIIYSCLCKTLMSLLTVSLSYFSCLEGQVIYFVKTKFMNFFTRGKSPRIFICVVSYSPLYLWTNSLSSLTEPLIPQPLISQPHISYSLIPEPLHLYSILVLPNLEWDGICNSQPPRRLNLKLSEPLMTLNL